jgi:YceI-like domain
MGEIEMNPKALSRLIGLMLFASEPTLVFAAGVEFAIQPESLIRLDGGGTMHDWSAQTREISGQWETTTNWLKISPTPVPYRCESRLTVSISAASIHSIDLAGKPFNSLEGGWIRHSIQSDKHPMIRFTLDQLTLTNALQKPTPTWEFVVQGKLALAGVTNTINFPARLIQIEATQLKALGTAELTLKDFAIEPPLIQLVPDSKDKTSPPIRVFNNEVKLTFDLVFKSTVPKVPAK